MGRPTHHVGSLFSVHGLVEDPLIMEAQCLLFMVCREAHSACSFIFLLFMVCRENRSSCRFSVYYLWFTWRTTHHVGSVFIVHVEEKPTHHVGLVLIMLIIQGL